MAAAGPAHATRVEVERVPPPAPAVLGAVALGGLAAAAVAVALAVTSDHVEEPGVQAALMVWVVLGYVLAGVVAWWRRPESRIGPLMAAVGFTIFLSSLSWANAPLPFTVGIAFDLLPAVLFLHVFLSFPGGRLEGGVERALVAVGYVTAFALQLAGLALGGFGPDNALAVVSEAQTAYSLLRVQLVVLSACALAGIAVIFVRRRRAGRPLRRAIAVLIDAFALVLVMVTVLFLSGASGLNEGQAVFEWIRRVTFFVLGLAPIVFLVGLLQARLARASIADLLVELRARPAPADLPAALARALRDPSVALVYWLPEFDGWADLDGRSVALDGVAEGRATTTIDRDDRTHVAALLHDPSLDDEPELLDGVVAAAAMALENARLHAELQARLDELRGSRSRLVEAGDTERRRLERNLHDGAQQRLVALSLSLRLVSTRLPPDSDEQRLLAEAREELAASLRELRELAQGIHPAVLSDHGLAVALESLAARAAVPVTLRVDLDGRLPAPVEVAAYYLVSEGLTNIAKYAQATSATVDVAHEDGHLVVQVADDGVGGADPQGGSGLRGLADRVEALDGRLRVVSAPAEGTRVRAEIPCAS